MMIQAPTSTKSLNKYASKQKMNTTYSDLSSSDLSSQSGTIFTVVDTFASSQEARHASLELQRQGLLSSQIVIITRNYQEYEHSINWEYITIDGGLPEILMEFGIDIHSAAKFEVQVKNGQFLVVAVVKNRSAIEAQYLLANIGRKVIAVY
ncbi:hypothetical protein [Pseudanabaena mucicola]|uniref:SPOR domain-containing protein n=1 Tax=Pseudanabaena mucicola FACHB-723 TaxID=2692860 RepID=A0ABR7ZY82_9CYAN|nr:hypothetical protein [Pseudanabaena mucicola]MBD2188465.1 hypothetical protein [Pseudanabaena mucicola FACHB-723]